MAKTTGVQKVVTKAEFVELASKANPLNQNDMRVLFDTANLVPMDQMTKVAGDDYLNFEEGETVMLICHGIIEGALPSKVDPTKMTDAVSFEDREGSQTINADAVCVSTVKKLIAQGRTFPMMMCIFCKGEKRSPKGTYKDLEIRIIQ